MFVFFYSALRPSHAATPRSHVRPSLGHYAVHPSDILPMPLDFNPTSPLRSDISVSLGTPAGLRLLIYIYIFIFMLALQCWQAGVSYVRSGAAVLYSIKANQSLPLPAVRACYPGADDFGVISNSGQTGYSGQVGSRRPSQGTESQLAPSQSTV